MKMRIRPQVERMEGRALMTAGALDVSFGGTGMVSTQVSSGADRSYSVAVQPDLKLVAYGMGLNAAGAYQLEVGRYNPDGSLDTTFGSSGKVIIGSGSTTSTLQASGYGKGMVLQPDGKMVLIGSYYVPNASNTAPHEFEVVRLNPNGSLDTTFGRGAGKVITTVTPQSNSPLAVALQGDGKIVVAGQWAYLGTSKTGGVEVVRYNTDGSLDTTFGTGGEMVISPPKMLAGTFPQVDSLALDSAGRILVVGSIPYTVTNGLQYYEGFILRFTTAGKLDTTFGSAGEVTTLPTGATSCEVRDVGLQSTGKIVVVGSGSQSVSAMARYNDNGSLDTTFGTKGFSPLSSQVTVWNPFVIAADDKIVVGCVPLVNGTPDHNTWVMRVLVDGTAADTGFGQGGLAEAPFGVNTLTRGITIGPDGKIVVASLQTSSFTPQPQFRIARFLGDTTSLASAAVARTATPAVATPDPTLVPLVLGDADFLNTLATHRRRQVP